jgi:hypothetical protein
MRLSPLTTIGIFLVGLQPARIIATTASPTSSCGNLPTPSPTHKPQFHCRSQGVTRSATAYTIKVFPSKTGNDDTCYQGCLGDASCISFSYNKTNGSCATYKASINALMFNISTSSNSFYSHLKGCFLPATCEPVRKQYIPNGGFEDAVPDSEGHLYSSGWSFEGAQIQNNSGHRNSGFSLLVLQLRFCSSVIDANSIF